MAAAAKSVNVVVDVDVAVVDEDELAGRVPEKSAASAVGEDVGRLAGMPSEFKLNPAAKEFVPASRLPPYERNGGVNVAPITVGRSACGLSADAPEFVSERRRNTVQRDRRINYRGWRRRMNRYRRRQADCIRRTVHISDIDGNVTEEELAAVFSSCGKVIDCRICGDQNSVLRFGFVEFSNEYEARAALGLGGIVLGFFPILVFSSKTAILPINPAFLPQSEDELERCSRTIYCTNIDKQITHIQVRDFFESFCGQVSRLRLLRHHSHSTKIAFVEFNQAEGALTALNCSGMFLGAYNIRVNPSKTPVRTFIL